MYVTIYFICIYNFSYFISYFNMTFRPITNSLSPTSGPCRPHSDKPIILLDESIGVPTMNWPWICHLFRRTPSSCGSCDNVDLQLRHNPVGHGQTQIQLRWAINALTFLRTYFTLPGIGRSKLSRRWQPRPCHLPALSRREFRSMGLLLRISGSRHHYRFEGDA